MLLNAGEGTGGVRTEVVLFLYTRLATTWMILIHKGILREEGGIYVIGKPFCEMTVTLVQWYPRFRNWNNHWYFHGLRSLAHSRLYRRTYGIDLCQNRHDDPDAT